ncbi:cysteine dioxygenase family protein [Shimia sp.]|uniref:cysteine dioxygenase family protein n=1 Tax=Shimia sp. TaxID=1954381 RepID=UPI003298FD9E
MDIHEKRSRSIVETMGKIKSALSAGLSVEALNQAKAHLSELAAQSELFSETDFPWPSAEENNHMYCIYRGENGDMALYVDVLLQGAGSTPHNHGNSWAIISGVRGREKHNLFHRVDGGDGPGQAKLKQAGSITIASGESVSMQVGGIHSVETVDDQSVLMLHCYGRAFEDQTARLEFDIASGSCAYGTSATGAISEFPLHESALS